jgi:hypothetical protein
MTSKALSTVTFYVLRVLVALTDVSSSTPDIYLHMLLVRHGEMP